MFIHVQNSMETVITEYPLSRKTNLYSCGTIKTRNISPIYHMHWYTFAEGEHLTGVSEDPLKSSVFASAYTDLHQFNYEEDKPCSNVRRQLDQQTAVALNAEHFRGRRLAQHSRLSQAASALDRKLASAEGYTETATVCGRITQHSAEQESQPCQL